MELQHYMSVNLSSSSDSPKLIDDGKCHFPVPKKEEDHETVTWKMDMPGCDKVMIHYEKNMKALVVTGITAGKITHACRLFMSKGFELNQVKLVKIQSGMVSEMGNMLAKVVVIKVNKDEVLKKKTRSLSWWKWMWSK
ncbi:hypothetical protein ACHQM5_022511 [Ranunculus cassubicifolius]